jgi:hypothetical protein
VCITRILAWRHAAPLQSQIGQEELGRVWGTQSAAPQQHKQQQQRRQQQQQSLAATASSSIK